MNPASAVILKKWHCFTLRVCCLISKEEIDTLRKNYEVGMLLRKCWRFAVKAQTTHSDIIMVSCVGAVRTASSCSVSSHKHTRQLWRSHKTRQSEEQFLSFWWEVRHQCCRYEKTSADSRASELWRLKLTIHMLGRFSWASSRSSQHVASSALVHRVYLGASRSVAVFKRLFVLKYMWEDRVPLGFVMMMCYYLYFILSLRPKPHDSTQRRGKPQYLSVWTWITADV